jgi:hypothetical protein
MCAGTKDVKTIKLRVSAEQGDKTISHPPCSANLAPSYFHIFDLLKVALRGCRFADDDEPNRSASEELQHSRKEF